MWQSGAQDGKDELEYVGADVEVSQVSDAKGGENAYPNQQTDQARYEESTENTCK